MGLIVTQVYVAGYDKNFSYLVYDEVTMNAVIVDPSGEIEKVLAVIEKERLDLVGVLLTHTHHDHYDRLSDLLARHQVPVYVHQNGKQKISHIDSARSLSDQELFFVGEGSLKVIFTLGHIDDAVCFYIDKENATDGVSKVITGDTLFVDGCGRTTADWVDDLYTSLQKLKKLPDETLVYPGHDYGHKAVDTIGHQKSTNKYLLAENLEEFKAIRLR